MAGKLQVRNLSYDFLTRNTRPPIFLHVLHDLNFDVNPGEVFGIIGPSGCGKTTLLNLIASFIPQQKGEILLDGVQIQKPNGDRVIISQEQDLFPWMTALGNVTFGLRARRMPKETSKNRARQYMHFVGLNDFASRFPHELSGGMKQRLALARALAVEPALMLMDEPFAALDAQSRKELQYALLSLWSKVKPTTILVTHDIEEAIYLSDRIMVLSHRPSCIQEIVTIHLSDRRTYEDHRTPRFLELKTHIEDMLSPRQ